MSGVRFYLVNIHKRLTNYRCVSPERRLAEGEKEFALVNIPK